jgi:hypothetical protein
MNLFSAWRIEVLGFGSRRRLLPEIFCFVLCAKLVCLLAAVFDFSLDCKLPFGAVRSSVPCR